MVEVRAAQVEALPAQKFEAWGVAGDGKGERVASLRILRELVVPGRVHGNLVGQRPQGG